MEGLIEAVITFNLRGRWEQMSNYRGAAVGKRENQIIKHSVGAGPCEHGFCGHVMTQLLHNSLSTWHSGLGIWEQPQALPFPQLTGGRALNCCTNTIKSIARDGPSLKKPKQSLSGAIRLQPLPNHLQAQSPRPSEELPAVSQELCSTTANTTH